MAENPIALRSKKRLVAALDGLMRTKPFHEITITELCSEAGLSRPAFYQNFARIGDVLSRLIHEKIEAALAVADFGVPGSARDLAAGCMGILDYDKEFASILVRDGLVRPYALEYTSVLGHHERFISSLGAFADEQERRFYAAFAAAGISVTVAIWMEERQELSREDVIDMMVRSLKGSSLS